MIRLQPGHAAIITPAPTVTPTTSTHTAEQRLQQELVDRAYDNGRLANLTTAAALPMVALLVWSHGSAANLLPWLTAVALVTLLRAVGLQRAQDNATPDTLVQRRHIYLFWTLANGIAWGMGALLIDMQTQEDLLFLAFTLGGVATVGVVVHGALLSAAALFVPAALLPLAFQLYREGGQPHTAMGIAVLLFIAILLALAAYMSRTSRTALQLEIANRDLVAVLEAAKHNTDVLNDTLLIEVGERREIENRLRALSAHLQSAREAEKAHLARELHDELSSILLALKIDASWLKRHLPIDDNDAAKVKLTGMMASIDSAVSTTRRISSGLRPPMLDDLGLLATLEWQLDDYQTRTGIVCTHEFSGASDRLSSAQAIALFRICQEALTNIARHARASRVQVQVLIGAQEVTLELRDNGIGIPANATRRPDAHGIYGMFERTRALGGQIRLDSPQHGGTCLRVMLPLDDSSSPATNPSADAGSDGLHDKQTTEIS